VPTIPRTPIARSLGNFTRETLIRAERSRLGLSGTLLHAEVNRWPRAIPHYNLALEKALEGLAPFAEGHYRLFGTYLGDLGLARVLGRAQELVRNFP
jgi:hypothetical protein